MRACGPGEFLVMVLVLVMVSGFWFLASCRQRVWVWAERLSHSVVATGIIVPTSSAFAGIPPNLREIHPGPTAWGESRLHKMEWRLSCQTLLQHVPRR